jgi:formylglycine-generating enzyme required for sulfatase activity
MRHTRVFSLTVLICLLTGCTWATSSGVPPKIDTGIDRDTWAIIPAGEFLQGQHEHETQVDVDYEIMITDVTNIQFTDFLAKAGQDGMIHFTDGNPLGWYPGDTFLGDKHEVKIEAGDYLLAALSEPGSRIQSVDGNFTILPGYENHPVTMVTWFGARAYCDYYGWRLPSEIEWEKAARGTDNRPFPWGEQIERNNANYYSSHDIFEKLAGKSDTTPVGFYNGSTYDGNQTLDSASPYGLYDMAGNVWQWTGDVYPGQHYRYMRGGSKENYAYNLRIWTRNSAAPDYYSPNVGFRCARDH